MATTCTVDDGYNVAEGDAVCVVGWDGGHSRPKVGRATKARLATSKTVFGVARADADDTDAVEVNVAGEVTEASIATGLAAGAGAGTSRIIATDITQTDPDPATEAALQCRLIRIDRPDGSEHVVGTCDENGHLAVLPRSSRETSARMVFNVRSYGAKGTGTSADDDSDAIEAAIEAANDAGGGIVFVPPGRYHVSRAVTPLGESVWLEGAARTGAYGTVSSVIVSDVETGHVISLGNFGGAATANVTVANGVRHLTFKNIRSQAYLSESDFRLNGNCAIEATGATECRILHCKFLDYPIGVVLDGAESILLDGCFFGAQLDAYPDYTTQSIGLWLTSSDSQRTDGFATGGSTSNITVRNTVFGGALNVYLQGAFLVSFHDCNVTVRPAAS